MDDFEDVDEALLTEISRELRAVFEKRKLSPYPAALVMLANAADILGSLQQQANYSPEQSQQEFLALAKKAILRMHPENAHS